MSTPATTNRLAIARAAYDDVPLYDPKRTPVKLDLTDNTNLWGVPPNAERAIREFASATVTRYPTLYGTELKAALATHAGVTPDMITFTPDGARLVLPRRAECVVDHEVRMARESGHELNEPSQRSRLRLPRIKCVPHVPEHWPPLAARYREYRCREAGVIHPPLNDVGPHLTRNRPQFA